MNSFVSIYQSPVGPITIIADEQAVKKISFKEKPGLAIRPNKLTEETCRQLKAYFEGEIQQFELPIAQEGTTFQQDVWSKLLDIPYGETISYAQFSAERPLAIRAMAAANGKNNLAIVVPCHRVIGSNGKLMGYAGELWRKKWLLEHEKDIAQKGQMSLKF